MMSLQLYDLLRSWMLPLKEIDALTPENGNIIDLGCGEGVCAKYLAKVKSRKITGVDNDAKRLQKSRLLNLKFELSDIRSYHMINVDAVIISDVLHHLSYKEQRKLLTRIAKSLKRNGILIIKEIDTNELIRSKLSRFWDFVFYPKDKIFYHNSKDFKNYLENLGFKVNFSRPSRLFPGSTTLFSCRKS